MVKNMAMITLAKTLAVPVKMESCPESCGQAGLLQLKRGWACSHQPTHSSFDLVDPTPTAHGILSAPQAT
jgi:hypothetical protein